jgi:hypothetical protein
MSAVLDQPKPQIFEAVNYFDKRVLGSNVKRWVWFPGDLIVPARKSEIDWLKVGGEETTSPCLQRYGRGFVPRGLAALLELGGEPIPMRHLGDLQAVAWQGIPLNENAVKNNFGFVPVYPGDGLRVLRRYSLNDGGIRKGLDEDTALVGKEWDECHNEESTGILDVIEQAMYGDGMSPTLSGLEDQIRFARTDDSRVDLGKMKADRLRMCDEFRNWASRKIAYEHGLLKSGTVAIATDAVGAVGGWSYSYSPITEMLLQQLDIPRQDQPLQEMARMVAQVSQQPAAQPQGITAVDMEIFERKMDERLAKAREADAARIAELEAQLAGGEKSDDAPKTYTCEHCGDVVKATGKGIHLGVHCRVLHPKTETTE